MILCLWGHPDTAFLLMLLSAVCDFSDGLAARLLDARSDLGRELDSLSDEICFGLLPSVMMVQLMRNGGNALWLCMLPLILAVFSALRLGRFNLDERQHESFIGLPTPAAAMICGSMAWFVTRHPESLLAQWASRPVFLPAVAILLSSLLVCRIPMFAMKLGTGHEADFLTKAKRTAFLTIAAIEAVLVVCLRRDWSLIVLLVFLTYIVLNLLFAVFPSTRRP